MSVAAETVTTPERPLDRRLSASSTQERWQPAAVVLADMGLEAHAARRRLAESAADLTSVLLAPLIGGPDPAWTRRAACLDLDGDPAERVGRFYRGGDMLSVCTECGVRVECLGAALHEEAATSVRSFGIRALRAKTRTVIIRQGIEAGARTVADWHAVAADALDPG